MSDDDKLDASPWLMGKLGRVVMLNCATPAELKAANVVDVLPVHEVDRNGCNSKRGRDDDIRSASLAHELFDAFAWVERASVQRILNRYVVKAVHSYPIDIEPTLRAWLDGHMYTKNGATFELQVEELCECGEPYKVCVCLSTCTDCGAVNPVEHDWCHECLHDLARGKREREKRCREVEL